MTLISVDGVAIAPEAIARESQHHRARTREQAWTMAARALVVRALLLREAERLGIPTTPESDDEGRRESDDEARIRALIELEVATPRADAESCRRYYEHNPRRFRAPDLFEASHILLPAAADDRAGREAAKARAREILGHLAEHPHDFANLARAHSACPSREQGGDLGPIGPGQTEPAFEAVLRTMAVGTTELIESRYGVHVARLDQRVEGRLLPFEAVHARIAAYLEARVHHRALHQYVAILAGRATVTGIELGAPEGPLVQ